MSSALRSVRHRNEKMRDPLKESGEKGENGKKTKLALKVFPSIGRKMVKMSFHLLKKA